MRRRRNAAPGVFTLAAAGAGVGAVFNAAGWLMLYLVDKPEHRPRGGAAVAAFVATAVGGAAVGGIAAGTAAKLTR